MWLNLFIFLAALLYGAEGLVNLFILPHKGPALVNRLLYGAEGLFFRQGLDPTPTHSPFTSPHPTPPHFTHPTSPHFTLSHPTAPGYRVISHSSFLSRCFQPAMVEFHPDCHPVYVWRWRHSRLPAPVQRGRVGCCHCVCSRGCGCVAVARRCCPHCGRQVNWDRGVKQDGAQIWSST